MADRDIAKLLRTALECSVYVAPADPGLTYAEILEIGHRSGRQQGEIGDALARVVTTYIGEDRIRPDATFGTLWLFPARELPDYRNLKALDFVHAELRASARAVGAAAAAVERAVLIERGFSAGIPRHDMEIAATTSVLSGAVTETGGRLRLKSGWHEGQPPSGQFRPDAGTRHSESRERVYQLVKDVIARRTDGRPPSAEPLDAFTSVLDGLGYAPFRLWWIQLVAELRRSDPQLTPVSTTVIAAALVEGALAFVVAHARRRQLGTMGSKRFDESPTRWKIDELVASGAAGQDSAILDDPTRQRAEALIRTRQRIHAGRMLVDYPAGVPDLRPEEAREAKATAELVVRRVIDWLQRFPPAA